MSLQTLFDFAGAELARRSDLSELEARGTLRLTLKGVQLAPDQLKPDELRAVVEHLLPKELKARGVGQADQVCAALAAAISAFGTGRTVGSMERPEDFLGRLRG